MACEPPAALADRWRWVFAKKWLWLVGILTSGLAVGLLVKGVPLVMQRMYTVQARVGMWQCALEMVRQHPLLGVGMGQYGRALAACSINPWGDHEMFVATAHNLYLNTAAESGLPGLLAMAFVLLGVCRLAIRRWRTAQDEWERLLVGGMTAALVGYAANCMVDTLLTTALALPALFLVAWLAEMPTLATRTIRWQRGGRAFMVATLLIYAIGLAWIDLGQWSFERSLRAAGRGDLEAALTELQRARKVDPWLGLYDYQAAVFKGQLAQDVPELFRNDAILEMERLVGTVNNYSLHQANLAILDEQAGDQNPSLIAMQQATDLNPSVSAYWFYLGLVAENAGLMEDARSGYAMALARSPCLAGSYFWRGSSFRVQSYPDLLEDAARQTERPGEIWLAAGDIERAANSLTSPVDQKDCILTGRVRLAQGRLSDALAAFDRAVALCPSCAVTFAARSEYYLATGAWDAAVRDARTALFVNPYDGARGHYVLAQVALKQGEREVAKDHLARAVPPQFSLQNWEIVMYDRRAMFYPLPPMLAVGCAHTEIEPWLELAALLREDGEVEEAAAVYQTILARDAYSRVALEGLRDLGLESE